MDVKLLKTVPMTKALAQKYGGKWKHHKASDTYYCDDNIRYVREVVLLNGDESYDNFQTYLYYNDGRPTEVVYL